MSIRRMYLHSAWWACISSQPRWRLYGWYVWLPLAWLNPGRWDPARGKAYSWPGRVDTDFKIPIIYPWGQCMLSSSCCCADVTIKVKTWRHGMETLSALLPVPPVTSGIPNKRPVMRSFDACFVVSLNNVLNKQLRCLRERQSSIKRHRESPNTGYITLYR